MREIKFRAWDKLQRKMIPVPRDWEMFVVTEPSEVWEIMQFTGLKDAKDREIYEGDILAGGNGGEVWYDNESCAYLIRNYHAEGLPIDMGGEVIGNIWENSNPLTSNKE